jgi:hypothetical protein
LNDIHQQQLIYILPQEDNIHTRRTNIRYNGFLLKKAIDIGLNIRVERTNSFSKIQKNPSKLKTLEVAAIFSYLIWEFSLILLHNTARHDPFSNVKQIIFSRL